MQRRAGHVLATCALWFCASASGAQVTTEHPASILVFPKIIADGTHDTTVQVSNVSTSTVHVRCFYTNAARLIPTLPPGPENPPVWQSTDFAIGLTGNQPTAWVASRGRLVHPDAPTCVGDDPPFDCGGGTGVDPGEVPALPDGFVGELRCIEIDISGAPLSGNHVLGDAAITTLASTDVSRYGAIGLAGFETNDNDPALLLGAEYASCPARWLLDHAPDGAAVPAIGPRFTIDTELTVVACSADYDTQIPAPVTLQLGITNDFEQHFSASTSIAGWGSFRLAQVSPIFHIDSLLGDAAQTIVQPANASASSILVVAEEVRTVGGSSTVSAVAAANVHSAGSATTADVIAIPAQSVP